MDTGFYIVLVAVLAVISAIGLIFLGTTVYELYKLLKMDLNIKDINGDD